MNNKKIIASISIVIILFITYMLITQNKKKTEYIIDKEYNIKLDDINKSMTKIDFNEKKSKDFFADDVVNPHTLKFFKFLQKKFKDMDYGEHLAAIKEYLYSIMPEDDAEKLYAIYKMFVEYELKISKKLNEWGNPENFEDALAILGKMHEFRRKFFGKELADALFGFETKSKEYPLRRKAILNDDSLYAKEKDEKLKKLNQDMWGEEADAVENIPEPYMRYKEKMEMYTRDMSEMTQEERKTKLREIREGLFSPEVVERLEGVDEQLAVNNENEKEYYSSEKLIISDPNLSDEEKSKKIHELQNEMFGKGADAFRRRENIRKSEFQNKK